MRITCCCLVACWAAVTTGSSRAQLPSVIDAYQNRVDLPAPNPPNPVVVGSAKQLLVDDWVVERSEGLTRRWHPIEKHPANPLLRPDEPWETPCVLLYGSVMYDPARRDDRFRMWYLCFTPTYTSDFSAKEKTGGRIAYAISADGIHWMRPRLGLHAFNGSKENNILIPGPHGFRGVEFDPRDPDPQRRYKAQARTSMGHAAFFSADGIHWSEPRRINLDGYDRSSIHWDPTRELWIASTKSWYRSAPDAADWRGRGYQESTDFLHWPGKSAFMAGTESGGPEIVYGLEPFYYESLFLGAWGRYREKPDGRLDVQLAVSRNARHWERPSPESWIPLARLPSDYVRTKTPGSPQTGVNPLDPRVPWDYGNNSINALGPIRVGDELWVYYSGRTSDHLSSPQTGAIGLGTMRLDGFCSLDADNVEGTVLTRPLRLEHGELRINADARGGSVQVEVADENGQRLEPFTRENCRSVTSDSVRHLVTWNGAGDIAKLQGKTVRLRFHMKHAKLYAFWTGEERNWHTPDTTTWSAR